jgi:CRISPR associated protein Cas1
LSGRTQRLNEQKEVRRKAVARKEKSRDNQKIATLLTEVQAADFIVFPTDICQPSPIDDAPDDVEYNLQDGIGIVSNGDTSPAVEFWSPEARKQRKREATRARVTKHRHGKTTQNHDEPTHQRPLKATVHSRIVFIEDDGVVLATYGLALVVRGQGIRLTELPASTRVVVLSGYGASITVAAMHACVSKHVEVFITSPRYGVMAMFVPSPVVNANRAGLAIRRKQFRAVGDPVRSLKVAQAIVGEKIKAERHARVTERMFLAGLRKAGTTDDVRHVEARAAQVWWEQWAEFGMRFKGSGVPAEWGLWPGRLSGEATG